MTDLSRRSFLAGIIAAGVAPLIVRQGFIMPIKPALVMGPPGVLTIQDITREALKILSQELVFVSEVRTRDQLIKMYPLASA